MAKVTRVKGNRLRLAIPLQTVTVTEHGTVTADYNVPAGAEVTVTLTGTWKTYKYVPEVNGNLLTITDEGTLPAGTYAVETTVVQTDGEHLRSKYCNMVEISDCNDGVTQEYDDFISGSVTLEEQIFYFAKGDKGDPGTTDYNDLQNKPDLSGFITISVNNLVNYYLKSETYTKQEVQGLIAAIQQFHYEIYASTSDVTSPQGNVLYLIGPTGTGTDKYEEYVYDSTKQEHFVKIGDTSIDLSDYYTKGQTDSAISQALNAALADYTTTAALTLLLAGKQDVINDLAEIRSGAALGATALQSETDPTVPQWAKQPQKPTYTAQEVGALPNSTKYGSTIDLAMDSATYVLTLTLKDQDGTVLNTKTVDLPIESVVVSGSYDATNKKIVLTLQGGSTIDVPVGDLIAGLQTEITSVNMLDADLVDDTNSTHKFVTEQEKTTWSNKQDTLVSGTNIKTVNNQSILGAGNIDIQGSYTPTLQSAPTSSTTTYTKDGQVVNFEIGQFVRVSNQNNPAGYDMYQLYDLTTENNATTAVWRSMDIVIGDINSVLDNINGEVI